MQSGRNSEPYAGGGTRPQAIQYQQLFGFPWLQRGATSSIHSITCEGHLAWKAASHGLGVQFTWLETNLEARIASQFQIFKVSPFITQKETLNWQPNVDDANQPWQHTIAVDSLRKLASVASGPFCGSASRFFVAPGRQSLEAPRS